MRVEFTRRLDQTVGSMYFKIVFVFALFAGIASAVTILPDSHHQKFLSYGLFTEEQTTLVLRGDNHSWAAIGDSLALIDLDTWGKPQFVVSGSVNFAFRNKSSPVDYFVETFDARFGISAEFHAARDFRFWASLTHLSGHAGDGLLDLSLAGPNLAEDQLTLRALYDGGRYFRIGGTLRFALTLDPSGKLFSADQFMEWYPFSVSEDRRGINPYLALGLEQYGTQQLELTSHLQVGVALGNHFQMEKQSAVRIVAGYYRGMDPRLKYARYKLARSEFVYLGLMANL